MSPPAVEITQGTSDELPIVVDVYKHSFIPMFRSYHPEADPSIFDIDEMTEMWKKLLDTESVFLVRRASTREPIAVLVLSQTERADVIELAKLFVVPEAQSTGVAQIVADFAVGLATTEGFREMELWTWEISHQSRRFYEKIGFVLASERGFFECPGVKAEGDVTVRYVKQLAS